MSDGRTPDQLAAERERALQSARGARPGEPRIPSSGGRERRGTVDFKQAAEEAKQLNRESPLARAELKATDGNGWQTRARSLIKTDEGGSPLPSVPRAVDMKSSDGYGPQSKNAVSVINTYFERQECSEIHFSGPDALFAKVNGQRVQINAQFSTVEEYNRFIEDLIHQADTNLKLEDIRTKARSVVRLAGGDRMAILMPPLTEYISAAIHKVVARTWDMRTIVENGTLTPSMAEFLQAAVRCKANILVCGEMGAGKSQPMDSPVLTPQGWKPMSEISVGDLVVAGDGLPTRVIGVHPQGSIPTFRITFSDGSSTLCSDDHLWQVQTPLRKWKKQAATVKPLNEIRQRLQDAAGNNRWFVPMSDPVEFTSQEVDIDPYVLGTLLGDGSIVTRSIEVTTIDTETVDRLETLLPLGYDLRAKGSTITYAVRSGRRRNAIADSLQDMSLLGRRCHDKFVPDRYKYNTTDVRWAVLQGLLDTDGHAERIGKSTIEYTSTSRRLADDVIFLAESFGATCAMKERVTSYTTQGERRAERASYRVHISLPSSCGNPFRLERKLRQWKRPSKYEPTRAIVSVDPVGDMESQCISVEHPAGLYLTDRFVVTHNSTMLSLLVGQIAENERIALVEEVPEIFVDLPDVTRITYYPESMTDAPMGLAEVIDTLLYMRMDRVIVGEIHDKGMYKMLRVMATGSDGSLSTFHAGTVDQALEQVKNHVLLENSSLPAHVVSHFVRQAINLVVVLERVDGVHRVLEVAEVEWRKLAEGKDTIGRNMLFKFDRREKTFNVIGRLDENGKIVEKARKHGIKMNPAWFAGADYGAQR